MGLAEQAKADRSQHWGHLSSIQLAGGIISAPIIAVGSDILISKGVVNAIFSIILGNLIIFGISLCIVLMSYRKRLNAIENAKQFVGSIGGRILALFVLVTMIAWLPRQLAPASQFLQILPIFSSFDIGALLGTLASLILLFGIKGLKTLCFFSMIPLCGAFFAILFNAEFNFVYPQDVSFPRQFDFSGTSLIVASLIASIVDYPTFFRHSKSRKNSIIALLVILFVTIVIQCTSLALYKLFLVDKNFVSSLLLNGGLNSILIIIFLVISIITSASWNIYAASVGWESLFPKWKDRTEYAVIGLTATLLFTSLYIRPSFIPITNVADTVISGIAGVLIFEYLRIHIFHEKKLGSENTYNNISWWIGGYVGLITYFLTQVPYYSTFVSLVAGFGTITTCLQLRKLYIKFLR